MNRIEEKLSLLTEKKEKAFVTYMTAGLPDIKGTKDLIFAQQEAGADIIELGIPFSDPCSRWADSPECVLSGNLPRRKFRKNLSINGRSPQGRGQRSHSIYDVL